MKERTHALAQSEARYRVLFEDSPLAVIVYDVDSWRIHAANGTCSRITGYAIEALVGNPVSLVVGPEQDEMLRSLARTLTPHSEEAAYTGQLHFLHRDGHEIDTEGIVQHIDYPGCNAQIMMLQDVTERRQTEERLRQEVKSHQLLQRQSGLYDALTGLPNQPLFAERMRQGFDQIRRTGRWMVVCHLDIDNFKSINETYGQEMGDHHPSLSCKKYVFKSICYMPV